MTEIQDRPMSDRPSSGGSSSALITRLAWSVGAAVAFLLLGHLRLPGLPDGFGELGGGLANASLTTLGLAPFVAGFLVVELFSLIPITDLRRSGLRGRRTMNRWALRLSMLIATVQAFTIVRVLEGMTLGDGFPLVDIDVWDRLLLGVSLVTGAAVVYLLGRWATAVGLGNGLCLLFLVRALPVGGPDGGIWIQNLLVLGVGAATFCALLVALEKRAEPYDVTSPAGVEHLTLPAFPQSLLPLAWGLGLWNFPMAFGFGPLGERGSPLVFLALAAVVALLSWLTVHLFSTRRRLAAALPPGVVPVDGFEAVLRRRLVPTSAFLVAMALAMAAHVVFGSPNLILGVVQMAMLGAFALDLYGEWRFRRPHPRAEPLAELDNVHLAIYLRVALDRVGVPCVIQARHFRSLFFFWQPLFKMAVLVPEDRLGDAREIFDGLDARNL
ncbi:MAG: hypothetical protein AAGD06_17895 [Acidobacteriota bacterium]